MSLFTIAFIGVAPFGNLLAGTVAARLAESHGSDVAGDLAGASIALRIAGAICIAGALTFIWRLPSLRQAVHPIYRQRGILPPEA